MYSIAPVVSCEASFVALQEDVLLQFTSSATQVLKKRRGTLSVRGPYTISGNDRAKTESQEVESHPFHAVPFHTLSSRGQCLLARWRTRRGRVDVVTAALSRRIVCVLRRRNSFCLSTVVALIVVVVVVIHRVCLLLWLIGRRGGAVLRRRLLVGVGFVVNVDTRCHPARTVHRVLASKPAATGVDATSYETSLATAMRYDCSECAAVRNLR